MGPWIPSLVLGRRLWGGGWGGGGWGGGGWGGDVAYYNPYYSETTLLPAPIDYSVPLPVPLPDTTPIAVEQGVETPPDTTAGEATALFDEGRAAFRIRDYPTASRGWMKESGNCRAMLRCTSSERDSFSMQRYDDAAASIYAVLAVGPGWNWATVSGLYSDPNQYTNELRALEAYVTTNPSDVGEAVPARLPIHGDRQ